MEPLKVETGQHSISASQQASSTRTMISSNSSNSTINCSSRALRGTSPLSPHRSMRFTASRALTRSGGAGPLVGRDPSLPVLRGRSYPRARARSSSSSSSTRFRHRSRISPITLRIPLINCRNTSSINRSTSNSSSGKIHTGCSKQRRTSRTTTSRTTHRLQLTMPNKGTAGSISNDSNNSNTTSTTIHRAAAARPHATMGESQLLPRLVLHRTAPTALVAQARSECARMNLEHMGRSASGPRTLPRSSITTNPWATDTRTTTTTTRRSNMNMTRGAIREQQVISSGTEMRLLSTT
mmetsp:Transcript_23491/g.74902  ORF Transcript_23491/g.74902 Transcript_23491/m.74902 type:complete len:296 (+) Transcript_23491:382-1269(+)